MALALDALSEGLTVHDAAGNLIHANAWARAALALDRLDIDERQRCRTGTGQLMISRDGGGLRYDQLPFRSVFRTHRRTESLIGLSSGTQPSPTWIRALCFRQPGPLGLEETAVTLWMRLDEDSPDDAETLRAIAAHELRTPLTALQLTLDALGEKLSRDPGMGKWIGAKIAVARGQCRRMGRLIDRLLDPDHHNDYDGPLELERLDVADLVREVALQQADKLLRAGCELQVVLSPAQALVDRVRLEEVVENLLSNVCKYARGARVEVRVERRGECVRLLVRDDGPGVPEGEREAVFARHGRSSTAAPHAGLGLGLYLVRRIAQAHGGAAWLDGRTPRGAQFVVEFPVAPPQLSV